MNTQLSFTYLQNNNPSVYHGGFNANELSNYYPEFNGSIEWGKTKGLFYALAMGGTASFPNIFHEDFSFGKHFVTHNNRWRFSPSMAFGYISSNVSFPQTVDNSTDVSIFGTVFPHMTRSNSSVTYSDKITMYMFNRSAYFKLQGTLSPRIKNDFPLRFTIGYRVTVTKDLEINIKSPTASSSYSWTAAGINFSNGNASPDHSLSYNGVFFELTWLFKSHPSKQF